mgnify:CR=1 FL=1
MKAPLHWEKLIMYEKNNVAIKVQVCDKCISSEMREEKKLCARERVSERKKGGKWKVIRVKILEQSPVFRPPSSKGSSNEIIF